MPNSSLAARRTAGFAYLALIFVVATFGISAAIVSEYWNTVVKREKEKELLFVGNQFRRAIGLYYEQGGKTFPRQFDDMLKDPRSPNIARYLRRLYPDPVTGSAEWGLVRDETGGIQGVFSLSAEAPVKLHGFATENAGFEKKEHYSEWKFVYIPSGSAGGTKATAAPAVNAAEIH